MLNRTLTATLLAASFSFLSTSAFAASVYINNAGFETDSAGNVAPTGWTLYNPIDPNPDSKRLGTFSPGGNFYTTTPEGSNVGIVYLDKGDAGGGDCFTCNESSDGDYYAGMEQTI